VCITANTQNDLACIPQKQGWLLLTLYTLRQTFSFYNIVARAVEASVISADKYLANQSLQGHSLLTYKLLLCILVRADP